MTDFMDKHRKEITQAKYWQRRGRMNPDEREDCINKQAEIWDRLEALYAKQNPEATE
jgi:hypothetical protein